jgi:hypothetical protein
MIMLKTWMAILAAIAMFGCQQLPRTQADLNAQKFESVPDKAVVYLVRRYPDMGDLPATLWLDNGILGSTYPGTYFRLELTPGRHTISGYGVDTGRIVLDLQPGRVYFVRHTVLGTFRAPSPQSFFQMLNDTQGRADVARATILGALG